MGLSRGRLAIRQVLVKVGSKAQFKEAPKSANGYRTIRFSVGVVAALTDVRRTQVEARLESPV